MHIHLYLDNNYCLWFTEILGGLSYSASEHMVATDPVDSQTTTSHVLSDNTTFGASHDVETAPPSVESESTSHENTSLPEPTQGNHLHCYTCTYVCTYVVSIYVHRLLLKAS